jgi:hypothetical protein
LVRGFSVEVGGPNWILANAIAVLIFASQEILSFGFRVATRFGETSDGAELKVASKKAK